LTILRLAASRDELRIVSDQVGAPTCALEVAVATTTILSRMGTDNNGSFVFPGTGGFYHMSAAGQTTWCEFAKTILESAETASGGLAWFAAATKGQPLKARRIVPISTKEFASCTRRPAYSVLANSRLNQTFGVALPDWRDQLQGRFADERAATISTA